MSINNNYPLLTLTITKSKEPEGKYSEDTVIKEETLSNSSASQNYNPVLTNSVASMNNIASTLIQDIKEKIYKYNHTQDTSAITTSYGTSFDAIMSSLNISPGGEITKSELIRRTRNDSNEDSNNDLCGALNRAFSYKGLNDDITYNDMMLFFMRGAGNDSQFTMDEYQNVVNRYSEVVQSEYDALTSDQQRLDYIINKTEQYLEEAGLSLQKEALNRLKNANNITKSGLVQTAASGNITLAEFRNNDGSIDKNTGGAYSFEAYAKKDNDKMSEFWTGDKDTSQSDYGITLNNYFFGLYHWFDLVMILVHELTHATAYRYYENNGSYTTGFNISILDSLVQKGLLTSQSVNCYKNFDVDGMAEAWLQVINNDSSFSNYTQDEKMKLAYAQVFVNNDPSVSEYTYTDLTTGIDALWDEFAAYYMTTEYYDSIGADAIICKNSSKYYTYNGESYYLQYFNDNLAESGTRAEYDAIKEHLYSNNSDYACVPELDYNTYQNLGKLFYSA